MRRSFSDSAAQMCSMNGSVTSPQLSDDEGDAQGLGDGIKKGIHSDPGRGHVARHAGGAGEAQVEYALTEEELCGILGDEAIRRRGLPAPG
jgi:hypothetical protein